MEPRLFSRGNPDSPDARATVTTPSMEPRLFSRGNNVEGVLTEAKFFLQWSHDYLVVETWRTYAKFISPMPSMEPRLFSRGNIGYRRDIKSATSSFNGATTI